MTFVVGKEIIAVNDSHCVIQLQPEFKSQSASRITFQNPTRIPVGIFTISPGFMVASTGA